MIHPTAIISPDAKIAADVEIGPYTVIGPHVEIDSGSIIASHVVINGPTKIGKNNQIFQFASVGENPQDKKYNGEKSILEIGDGNVIRECCTINRGTALGGDITKIGNNNLFMAYVHIAHDCIIGNNNIFANYAALSGHVIVEDFVNFGGYSGVHQFCRVGAHSFIAKATIVSKDVLPYVMVAGSDPKTHGLNLVGLKRRGFTDDTIAALKQAYKIIFRRGLTVTVAIDQLKPRVKQHQEIQNMIDILVQSERGVVR